MTKKCIGCGLPLNSTNKEDKAYTPSLKNDYCMRCFRLKHYNQKSNDESISESEILSKINHQSGVVFFFLDYLNINAYTLNLFKKINLQKILVISKSDVLRKDMKYSKITTYLNQVYGITDPIKFVTNKNNYANINIFKSLDNYQTKTAYIMGLTNAGKSTFINHLLKTHHISKEILTSNKPNTTLSFIKINIAGYTIYDTPGFNYEDASLTNIATSLIKPLTYNLKKPTTILIEDKYYISFNAPTSITLYVASFLVKRLYKPVNNVNFSCSIPKNSDLVLPQGLGFINIKSASLIKTNFLVSEIRPNISGESYE